MGTCLGDCWGGLGDMRGGIIGGMWEVFWKDVTMEALIKYLQKNTETCKTP